MAIVEKQKNLKKRLIYLLAILVILALAYFIVYQKFINTPEVSTTLLEEKTEVRGDSLARMVNDLFKDPQFSSLKTHGTLLPLSLKPKSSSGEIEGVGVVGRSDPFTP